MPQLPSLLKVNDTNNPYMVRLWAIGTANAVRKHKETKHIMGCHHSNILRAAKIPFRQETDSRGKRSTLNEGDERDEVTDI